jgi:hypothetical protein
VAGCDEAAPPSSVPARVTRTWLLRVLATLLVAGSVLTAVLYYFSKPYQHRVSAFICMGDQLLPPQERPRDVYVFRDSFGYDGQFYYYLARHLAGRPDEVRYLDNPAHRYRRIGYPLLVRLLSFGITSAIPSALLLVNLLSVFASIVLLSVWFRERGIDPLYALLFALSGTLLYPLLRDLSEIVTAVFMIGGLLAYFRRRYWLGGFLLGYAMLTREVSLGIALVLVVDWLFLRKQKRSWITPLVSACIMVGWHLWVFFRTNAATYPFRGNFGTPALAMLRHAHELFVARADVRLAEQIVLATSVLIIALSIGIAVWEFTRSRHPLSLCLLGYSFMPLAQGAAVWVEPWSYCRMLVPSLTMLVLCFARSGSRWYLLPLSAHGLLFVASLAWLLA